MNKSIVIYTETSLPNINVFFNSDYMIILKSNMNINLIDNYSLLLNNEYLYYDYLITDEIETLKMREKIYPPLSTYTATSDDVGAVMKDNIDSELNGNSNNNSTIQSNENGGNEFPEANV